MVRSRHTALRPSEIRLLPQSVRRVRCRPWDVGSARYFADCASAFAAAPRLGRDARPGVSPCFWSSGLGGFFIVASEMLRWVIRITAFGQTWRLCPGVLRDRDSELASSLLELFGSWVQEDIFVVTYCKNYIICRRGVALDAKTPTCVAELTAGLLAASSSVVKLLKH